MLSIQILLALSVYIASFIISSHALFMIASQKVLIKLKLFALVPFMLALSVLISLFVLVLFMLSSQVL